MSVPLPTGRSGQPYPSLLSICSISLALMLIDLVSGILLLLRQRTGARSSSLGNPPLGSVKINFDGSVQSRLAGSAFVIRDPDGSMIAAGGFGSLDLSVPLAELYATWAGISYAIRSLGSRHLIIEGDSFTVVRWLRQDVGDPEPANPLLRDIRSLLHQATRVQVRHIYREANSAADWVATRVAHHSGFWSWRLGDDCPLVLSQILYSDMSGLTHARLV